MSSRTCYVHCAQWPIAVARAREVALRDVPLIVRERIGARDVVRAASREALTEGVRVGMRRREAEARCAGVAVVDADLAHEMHWFERVARAIESLTPRIEIMSPGRLLFATLGPSRYFGGDAPLADRVVEVVLDAFEAALHSELDVRVGIADSRFAARLAARTSSVIAEEATPAFLAPFPVVALGDPALADILERLGLGTLGAFAALPRDAVLSRFGEPGARLYALARGYDPDPLAMGAVPPDCDESVVLEPPASRVDEVAFVAKTLADRLVAQLAARGLACTRIAILAETEHGEQLARSWRHEDGFQPAALAERVRWQLDGWLHDRQPVIAPGDVRAYQDVVAMGESGLDSTTGALTRLCLQPEEIIAIPARQLGLFGGDPEAALRADRVLSRVQGMLGYESVGTFVAQGGRTPSERVVMVPWGEPREPQRPLVVGNETVGWPGAIPPPFPARVFPEGLPAQLLDEQGEPVRVSLRGIAMNEPARLHCDVLGFGHGAVVVGWAGPWPCDVRWWDAHDHVRGVRWHVVCRKPAGGAGPGAVAVADEIAMLVMVTKGNAVIEALYD